MYLHHLTSGTKGTAVLFTICGLCIGWAERDRQKSLFMMFMLKSLLLWHSQGYLNKMVFFLVKILTWVLGDLSSKPDVPQHVGERVSKSLNYSVPYFCLQTVSNIHPVLCLCKAPQSLAKNLLIASHIKGLKQIEAAAVHQLWMQRGQVLRPNSRTNVNKPQIYFTSSESMLGLQKCSATSLLFPTHCSNYLQNLLVVMPPLAPSQGLDCFATQMKDSSI